MDWIEILRWVITIAAVAGASYGTWWYATYRNDQTASMLARIRKWMDAYGDLLKEADEALYDSINSLLKAVTAANSENQPISGFVKIVFALWGLVAEAEKRLSGAYGDTFEVDDDDEEEESEEEGLKCSEKRK